MRLVLCLLLVILAVCCYEATASSVCYAFNRESATFLLFSEKKLKTELERYNAPPEAVEAKLKVKRCVDSTMSYIEKTSIGAALTQVLLYCEFKQK